MREAIRFNRQELEIIYEEAVNGLGCAYRSLADFEDVDVSKQPPERFDIKNQEWAKTL